MNRNRRRQQLQLEGDWLSDITPGQVMAVGLGALVLLLLLSGLHVEISCVTTPSKARPSVPAHWTDSIAAQPPRMKGGDRWVA